eukprot:269053_1
MAARKCNQKTTTIMTSDDLSYEELQLSRRSLNKVINNGIKKTIGLFHLQCKDKTPLMALTCTIEPEATTFKINLYCGKINKLIANSVAVNFIICCNQLNIDCWVTCEFQSGKTQIISNHKFLMKALQTWYNREEKQKYLRFGILIKELYLIHPKYANDNTHANNSFMLVRVNNLQFHQRHFKFTWTIPCHIIKQFPDYKIGQWYKSHLFDNAWYIVLYPRGVNAAKDAGLWWFQPGNVQIAVDMVSTIKNVERINVFYNAKLMQSTSHFVRLKAQYFYKNMRTGCFGSEPAQTTALLKCSDLLTFNAITIEIEIYTYCPSHFINGVYEKIPVTFWDKYNTISEIKNISINVMDMQVSYQWIIINDDKYKAFDNFLSAPLDKGLYSDLFDFGYLKWSLVCFPEGQHSHEKGFVKLSIALVDTLDIKLLCIIIRYQFYCVEYNTFQTGILAFRHTSYEDIEQSSVKWIAGALSLDYIQTNNKQQITFGFDAEILSVRNLQNDILYYKRCKFEFYTQIILDIDLTKDIVQSIYKYKNKIYGNLWSIYYVPEYKCVDFNAGDFGCTLHSLLKNVSIIKIKLALVGEKIKFFRQKEIIFDCSQEKLLFNGRCEFMFGTLHIKKLLKWCKKIREECDWVDNKIKISYFIQIVELVDIDGMVMKPNSNNPSEIFRLALYLYKHQKNYMESMYYLRKAYYSPKILNNCDHTNFVEDRLYVRLKRKLYKKLIGFPMARYCGHCKSLVVGNQKCKGCCSIYYCNKSCQKKHWKLNHRYDCLCMNNV